MNVDIISGVEALKIFGVPEILIGEAVYIGVTVKCGLNVVKFYKKDKLVRAVVVPYPVIAKAKAGSLSATMMAKYRKDLESALQAAIAKIDAPEKPKEEKVVPPTQVGLVATSEKLGEDIPGWSSGPYRVYAVGPAHSIAYKLENTTMSVRVYGDTSNIPALKDVMKFSDKGDYKSIHIGIGCAEPGAPSAVLGAVLNIIGVGSFTKVMNHVG